MSIPTVAFVREPGQAFARALGQKPASNAIDVRRARAQHAVYRNALRTAGLRVIELPAVPELPDACFVQDIALLLPDLAILGRPAEPTRKAEVEHIRPVLGASWPLVAIRSPGTLEWGDVLCIEDTLYVGQSGRTNFEGTVQLRELVAPRGLGVETVPVGRGLHLLSGVSYLGKSPANPEGSGVLLAWDIYAELPHFQGLDIIRVPADESAAANCLAIGTTVIMPAGYPQTAAAIWHRGFRVLTVPVSEYAKADGGVTCLSLLGHLDAT